MLITNVKSKSRCDNPQVTDRLATQPSLVIIGHLFSVEHIKAKKIRSCETNWDFGELLSYLVWLLVGQDVAVAFVFH